MFDIRSLKMSPDGQVLVMRAADSQRKNLYFYTQDNTTILSHSDYFPFKRDDGYVWFSGTHLLLLDFNGYGNQTYYKYSFIGRSSTQFGKLYTSFSQPIIFMKMSRNKEYILLVTDASSMLSPSIFSISLYSFSTFSLLYDQ